MTTKHLYAVELDITNEAISQGYRIPKEGYWVIHSEEQEDGAYTLCVYDTRKEAREAAKGRDHESRVVRFTRDR